MTINELHEIALDIMKDIHDCCIENNIQYSLAYGSLIGAVRHQGFIPWDNDIDVWMTRPNFEKFTKIFKSKRGYRLSTEYDKDSLICFNRVYETKRTYLKRSIKSCDGDVGVWVDIMPLDGVPDNNTERNNQYHDFINKIRPMEAARFWLNYIDQSKGLKTFYGNVRLLLNNMVNGNYRRIHQKMVEISKRHQFGKYTYCCYFQCAFAYRKRKQELLPVNAFNTYKLMPFEDTGFMVSKDYDALLTSIYGDYMKLPPLEDRVFHHGECYWK